MWMPLRTFIKVRKTWKPHADKSGLYAVCLSATHPVTFIWTWTLWATWECALSCSWIIISEFTLIFCSSSWFTLEWAMKTQRGNRGISILFLEPQQWMGVSGQRHAPAALLVGKTRYPLNRRLVGSQDRSGWVQNILPPLGFRSPDCPARSELLYWLHYSSLFLDV